MPLRRRGVGAEGNARDSHGVRAQNRAAPSSGVDRVRKAAQERKAEKFTALLHHIDAALLRQAYHWLKRDAAPGVDLPSPKRLRAGRRDDMGCLRGRPGRAAMRP
jgi:RNA-directed DNA polymerase